MIGKIRGAVLAAAMAFVGLATAAPAAKADFMYNLTVTGGFTGSGSITFDALTGNDFNFGDDAGVVAFSFHVSSGVGSPQDYELVHLSQVSWGIEASSLDLVTLLLVAPPIPFGNNFSALILALDTPYQVSGICGSFISDDSASIDCESDTHSSGALRAVAVPEPATMALFAAGLMGLGLIARRRKAV